MAYPRLFGDGTTGLEAAADSRQILDENNDPWQLTETDLYKLSDNTQTLERLPSHESFWFGWFAFNPQTKLYQGRNAPPGP